MKATFILMTTCLTLSVTNAQKTEENMTNNIAVQETISKLFIASDQRNWEGVEAQFAPKVNLDYSSMTENSATTLTPQQITGAWKTVLPGFASTHHQIGNVISEIDGNEAHVFCYGTATHYLEHAEGNIWTVVGSYDFDLENIENQWKIKAMTFNYKYQDGNTKLVQEAIENVKNN